MILRIYCWYASRTAGDSPPRAVQVVFRHGAIDLMPLLCRNRQERRCNPPFSPWLISNQYSSMGIARAAESRRRHANEHPLVIFFEINVARSHLTLSLVVHPSLRSVELCCFERSRTLQARPLITAGSPRKLGSNRTHLGWRRSLAFSTCSLGESMSRSLQQIFRNF